jgi:hypothetical protein
MPKVHLFPTISELLPGWRLPLQYIGTSETPAAKAAPDTVVLAWILANLPANPISVQSATVANDGTVAVAAGRMVEKIVVIGGASGTFNLGTSASGTEIMEGATFDTDGAVYALDNYFHSGGTLHFSGGFAGSLTVKLILINLS